MAAATPKVRLDQTLGATMTEKRSVVGDTAINVVAISCSLVGSLVFQSLLAWNLGPVGCGEYSAWIAIATIAAVVFTLGTDRAVQVLLISNRITIAQATCTTILIGMVGSIVAMTVLWLGFQSNWQFLAGVTQQNQTLALIVIPAIALPLALQLLLAGLRHFMAIAAINILRALLQIGLAAFLFNILDWDTKAAYTTFVFCNAMTAGAYLLFLISKYKFRTELVSSQMAASIAGYSLRYLPARLGNVVGTHSIVLILAIISTKHEVGIYALAAGLLGQSLLLSNALNRAIQPRICETSDGNPRLIAQCCRISMILYGALLLGFLVLIGPIAPVLFSERFAESTLLLWYLAPGVWLKGASKPLRAYFIGSNRPGVVSAAVITEMVIAIVSLATFYSLAGVTGVAIGVALGNACGAIVLAVAFHSCSKYSVVETWFWNKEQIQSLKDHVVVFLKIRLKRRTFYSKLAAANCPREQIPRQIVITPERVIKYQPHNLFKLELARTASIADIGHSSGLFSVPEILSSNEDASTIEFTRIHDIIPVGDVLTSESTSTQLIERIGKSLASIHNGLRTPLHSQIPLTVTWGTFPDIPTVCLHGDFTAQNVLYQSEADQLLVIDCATTDRCGAEATIGPWCFDISWFIQSLLHRRPTHEICINSLAQDASIFVRAYCAHRSDDLDINQFLQYFSALLRDFSCQQKLKPTSFLMRFRHRSISQATLDQFFQVLSSSLAGTENIRIASLDNLSIKNSNATENQVDITRNLVLNSSSVFAKIPNSTPLRRAL
jgi:O-antigen/teichoic acid export membrane protein/tRNA A-37 threonylcarbamoyl transferase component Bud32